MDGLDEVDTEASKPARQLRSKAVAHPSVPRRSLGEDLVAEDEEPHDRPSSDGDGVVPSSSRESDPRWRHDRACVDQHLPCVGLLACAPDVASRANSTANGSVLVDETVLAAEDSVAAERERSARGDPHRLARHQRRRPDRTREHLADDDPRAVAGDRPAVHRRDRRRRQRGERLHVLSGHEPMRLDEAHLLSGQPVDTRMRDLTSLVPARLDVRHQPTFSQPRFGAWLPASCGPRSR